MGGICGISAQLEETMQNISQCVKAVKEIETSTLLTIEAERQREFFEGIKELRETHDPVISESARRAQTVTRRFESVTLSYGISPMISTIPRGGVIMSCKILKTKGGVGKTGSEQSGMISDGFESTPCSSFRIIGLIFLINNLPEGRNSTSSEEKRREGKNAQWKANGRMTGKQPRYRWIYSAKLADEKRRNNWSSDVPQR
ncbi:hypothetical protein B0H14DRAFT_2634916 [Mycena olivaceomarginata]|nr:hypothetical protein B0H14DRAFT_2634916 [Mycena olivaceomarginata]